MVLRIILLYNANYRTDYACSFCGRNRAKAPFPKWAQVGACLSPCVDTSRVQIFPEYGPKVETFFASESAVYIFVWNLHGSSPNPVLTSHSCILFNIFFFRNELSFVYATRPLITLWDLSLKVKEQIFLFRIKGSLPFSKVVGALQRLVPETSSETYPQITAFYLFWQTDPVRKISIRLKRV